MRGDKAEQKDPMYGEDKGMNKILNVRTVSYTHLDRTDFKPDIQIGRGQDGLLPGRGKEPVSRAVAGESESDGQHAQRDQRRDVYKRQLYMLLLA